MKENKVINAGCQLVYESDSKRIYNAKETYLYNMHNLAYSFPFILVENGEVIDRFDTLNDAKDF